MKTLFLDDDFDRCKLFLQRRPDAHIVHTAADCIKMLDYFPWDQVFLDHDLSENPNNSGTVVVDWVVEHHPRAGQFIVHSWNIPRADYMVGQLQNAGYTVTRLTFGPELLRKL